MSAPSKPLQVGDTIACYTILEVINDAPSARHRRYWAKAHCCGLIVDRAEHSLLDARRAGAEMCHRCARQKANLNRAASYGFHERFGPVCVIDRGSEPKTWKVVWDCCGKETTIGQAYLNQLKVFCADGRDTVCLECSIKRSRMLAKERAKPTRKSRLKADLLASFQARQAPVVVPTPIAHPIPPIKPREAPQEPLVLQPMGATLPAGVVPAAMAWPRPGRASA